MSERLELIGYWASEREPEWPDPHNFIDRSWNKRERSIIVNYLNHATTFRASPGWSRCRVCGERNGDCELTDGTYYWPSGLAHYLTEHDVRLPDQFVRHAFATMAARTGAEYASDWWASQTEYAPDPS